MSYSGGYRLSLSQPSSIDKERIKREAFEEDRILVVSLDDPRLTWPDRELLSQIGARLYGQKRPPNTMSMGNGRKR